MFGIPIEVFYLLALLIFVAVFFVWFKRPLYEIMFLAFIFIIVITGSFNIFFEALIYPSTSSLFYAIFAFMVIAVIFEETKVVNNIINLLLSLVGRIRGGAGYVALLSSAFMASLSGSGPGNVAATGVFTIPTMKRSNFPPALAASVEMASSMLGNIIPPAGIIILTYGVLSELYPDEISLSSWMVLAYGVGFWFFLQRLITLWALCKIYKVEPVPKEEVPKLKTTFKAGWKALFLPLLIFIPLFADAQFKDFFTWRIGEDGAGAYSSSVLMFTPALAGAYAILIGKNAFVNAKINFANLMNIFKKSLTRVVPIGLTIYMAYAISQVFTTLEMDVAIRDWILSLGLNLTIIIVLLPIIFMILGMVLPGSAQVAILGGAMITVFATLGGNPVLFAALLPAMTGAMEGMTPPLALGLYVAMGIANSGFKETTKFALIWVFLHLILAIILLTGVIPIFGLN